MFNTPDVFYKVISYIQFLHQIYKTITIIVFDTFHKIQYNIYSQDIKKRAR